MFLMAHTTYLLFRHAGGNLGDLPLEELDGVAHAHRQGATLVKKPKDRKQSVVKKPTDRKQLTDAQYRLRAKENNLRWDTVSIVPWC